MKRAGGVAVVFLLAGCCLGGRTRGGGTTSAAAPAGAGQRPESVEGLVEGGDYGMPSAPEETPAVAVTEEQLRDLGGFLDPAVDAAQVRERVSRIREGMDAERAREIAPPHLVTTQAGEEIWVYAVNPAGPHRLARPVAQVRLVGGTVASVVLVDPAEARRLPPPRDPAWD